MYEELTAKAAQAAKNAYAPYSHFAVGAALLCADGTVFCGCNVENASYSATVCAERSALFAAVSAGKRHFTALAVHTPDSCEAFCPCAVCLQTLSEFCGSDVKILCTAPGRQETYTLGELLPHAFRLGGGTE